MTQKRRTFTAVEKAAAVREHLLDKIPVSQIADRMNVQPTMIHNWINTAMKQVERAFESPRAAKAGKAKHDHDGGQVHEKLNRNLRLQRDSTKMRAPDRRIGLC